MEVLRLCEVSEEVVADEAADVVAAWPVAIAHCKEVLPWTVVEVNSHHADILILLHNVWNETLFASIRKLKAKRRNSLMWRWWHVRLFRLRWAEHVRRRLTIFLASDGTAAVLSAARHRRLYCLQFLLQWNNLRGCRGLPLVTDRRLARNFPYYLGLPNVIEPHRKLSGALQRTVAVCVLERLLS
ncbi:unnamed protein product [Sphagnum jensenii]